MAGGRAAGEDMLPPPRATPRPPAVALPPTPPLPPCQLLPSCRHDSGTYSVEAAKTLPFPKAGGATGSIR